MLRRHWDIVVIHSKQNNVVDCWFRGGLTINNQQRGSTINSKTINKGQQSTVRWSTINTVECWSWGESTINREGQQSTARWSTINTVKCWSWGESTINRGSTINSKTINGQHWTVDSGGINNQQSTKRVNNVTWFCQITQNSYSS